MRLRVLATISLAAALSGCGGSPTKADDNSQTQNGCFAIVGNHGTITAAIAGLPSFSGVIPTGGAIYTPASSGVLASFIIQATDVSSGTSVLVGGPLVTGATTASISPPNAVTFLVSTRSCTASTGSFTASATAGAATVTLTSASATSVAGSFSGTVWVAPGTSSAGSKTISGNFSATF